MVIKNKIESYEKIIELNLNRFPEKIFTKNNIEDINLFLNMYPAEYYAIRDKSRSSGVFKLKVKANEILSEIDGYDKFSINVSSYNYIQNQLLVGEILITDEFVGGILSTNSTYSVRDAIKNPDYNIKTSIFDNDTLNQIPYFNEIYKYIIENKLKNTIVEFAYFNTPIGINNENIIVYELRTDY